MTCCDVRFLWLQVESAAEELSLADKDLPIPSGVLSPETVGIGSDEFMPSLPTLSDIPFLVTSGASNIAGVSAQTINSIASSLTGILPAAAAHGTGTTSVERSASRNSYSPSMSDSGISVDAGSNNSSNIHISNIGKIRNLPMQQQPGWYRMTQLMNAH